MAHRIFIRDVQARDVLEIFIVSGISSLLLLRYYLYLTGYPQVGSGSLHIAHMLYGGLLMLIAIILLLSFIGRRSQRIAALMGGVGFGIFIDEIGKFLTKDNNYFFRPAVGIIYAVFVLLYLGSTFLTRRQHLSSTEYQLNALTQLEEAVLHDMDILEKAAVQKLLKRADQNSPITKQLEVFLSSVKIVAPAKTSRIQRVVTAIDKQYERLWRNKTSNIVVQIFFGLQIAIFVLAVLATIYANLDSVHDFFVGHTDYGHSLIIGQAIGSAIAAWFVILGVINLARNRLEAFEWFRRATLANLLFTEFFLFSRIQFGAMPSFIFNLALLLAINLVLGQEQRQQSSR